MEHETATHFLRDGVVLLGFALAFVLVFRRLGLGATLGYLVAGALVGPFALHLVGDAEQMSGVGELGITLLLFIVGLELNPSRLWRLKREIFGLGLLQVVACGIAITGVLLLLTQVSTSTALALGLPLALSSTAQVLPMLQSAGRLRSAFGERAFAILLFQDLSIIPLITIVAALSLNPADSGGPPAWQTVLITLAAVAVLIAAGRFVIRPLFRLIGGLGEREMFVVAALFTVVAAAAAMQAIGASTALGAFIAGVMLADSPYRHELEADVEPFRSILLGLFFLSVGMMLDLRAIASDPAVVFGIAAALIVTKVLVITLLAKAFHMSWRGALGLGLLLSQGGEFGFVLFAQAQSAYLIDQRTASLFAAIVTLSMATTPFLMKLTARIRRAPEKNEVRDGPVDQSASALIVGYGRFGQTVAQTMMAAGISVTLIDTDVEMIDVARQYGAPVYFGDGTRMDLLRQAGAAEAEVILFCIDQDQIEPDLVHEVHKAFPSAGIYIRGYDRRTVLKLRETPADYVVREVMESAVKMARLALDNLGLSEEAVDQAETFYRANDKERLSVQIATGDVRAARETILTEPKLPDPRR